MFDNKTLKVQSARDAVSQAEMVCVCARACAAHSKTDKQITMSFGCVQAIKYTKYVKMAGYESIHLNTVYVDQNSCGIYWKSDVCQYIVLKWQTGAWTINVNQRKKCKEKITHSS